MKARLFLLAALAAPALAASGGSALGHGDGFRFVEESWRLPPDTSPPGTSSTDVDLVDHGCD